MAVAHMAVGESALAVASVAVAVVSVSVVSMAAQLNPLQQAQFHVEQPPADAWDCG